MDELQQITAEIYACRNCDLYVPQQRGVPGVGPAPAEILLIGEAPSALDERRNRPFSGPSGDLLDELLALAGVQRADVYLTNVVRHRPVPPRDLAPGEVHACAGYLTREIALVNPAIIVTLGRFALAHFFPRLRISRVHGQAMRAGRRLILAMYHPAAALHQEVLRAPLEADFRTALPAAIAAARQSPPIPPEPDEPPPEQMALF